jgi:hypothetical protein
MPRTVKLMASNRFIHQGRVGRLEKFIRSSYAVTRRAGQSSGRRARRDARG